MQSSAVGQSREEEKKTRSENVCENPKATIMFIFATDSVAGVKWVNAKIQLNCLFVIPQVALCSLIMSTLKVFCVVCALGGRSLPVSCCVHFKRHQILLMTLQTVNCNGKSHSFTKWLSRILVWIFFFVQQFFFFHFDRFRLSSYFNYTTIMCVFSSWCSLCQTQEQQQYFAICNIMIMSFQSYFMP